MGPEAQQCHWGRWLWPSPRAVALAAQRSLCAKQIVQNSLGEEGEVTRSVFRHWLLRKHRWEPFVVLNFLMQLIQEWQFR